MLCESTHEHVFPQRIGVRATDCTLGVLVLVLSAEESLVGFVVELVLDGALLASHGALPRRRGGSVPHLFGGVGAVGVVLACAGLVLVLVLVAVVGGWLVVLVLVLV